MANKLRQRSVSGSIMLGYRGPSHLSTGTRAVHDIIARPIE